MFDKNIKSILGTQMDGFFFLRNILADVTTPSLLDSIYCRVSRLYEDYSKHAHAVFNPHFVFEADENEKLVRLIISKNDEKIGQVNLVAAMDEESHQQVLKPQTDLWNSVKKHKYENLTIEKVKTKINNLSNRMNDSTYRMLVTNVSMIERIAHEDPRPMSFDFETSSDGIAITVYRDYNVFTYLFVATV